MIMNKMNYILESHKQVDGRPKKIDIVCDVTSFTRSSGVMYFETERNGTIRRRDDTWKLVSLRRSKLRSGRN